MKQILLFLFSLAVYFSAGAQTIKIDSLKGNWKTVALYDPEKFYYNTLTDSLAFFDKKTLGLSPDLLADDSIRAAANKLLRLVSKRQMETVFLMCDAKGNASLTVDGNTIPFVFSEKNQRAEAGKKTFDMKFSFQNGLLLITGITGNSRSAVWLKKE